MELSTVMFLCKFSSAQFSRSVVSDSLRPHEPQHARPPCPSPTPGVHPNPCPSSRWCHPTISSSVVPSPSSPQSTPASGSFPMSQLFASGGQSIRVSASASVLPVNIQDWFPLGWTGWISLQSKFLCKYAHYSPWELPHHPKLNSVPIKHQFPILPSLQLLATTTLLSVSTNLTTVGTSWGFPCGSADKWNHATVVLLCLVYFTYNNVFEVHQCCSVHQSFFPFCGQ